MNEWMTEFETTKENKTKQKDIDPNWMKPILFILYEKYNDEKKQDAKLN